MTQDKMTFKCSACGSTSFLKPDNPKPDDVIACAGCGATGRYADIQAAAVKIAKARLDKLVAEKLGGLFKKK